MPQNNNKKGKTTTGPKPLVVEGKHARGTGLARSTDSMQICWYIGYLDKEGPFGWENIDKASLQEIIEKAKHFEKMKWSEIKQATHGKRDKSNNHFVPISDCTKEARDRYKEMFSTDQGIDEIFCLRLDGQCRIWGIVQEHVFKVLWWDPHHGVCSSGKWK